MSPASTAARLEAVFAPAASGEAPGLVVGVAQHGRPLLRRGHGLASVEHGVANTPRTRMRLASVTKHMACLAALLLGEDGRLDLDAPVSKVLPELRRKEAVPTLRQLMSHTGGSRCYQELFYLGSALAFQPRGAGLALQLAQSEANFAAGTSQLYCNGGYGLVSEAIARASGMSFEAFMKSRIFAPLAMNDTEAVPSDMQIVPGLASFHVALPGGGWRRGITPMDDNRGEGSVVSSVDDMLHWLAHLRAPIKTVGSARSWAELTTPAVLADGTPTHYALGLNRHDYRGVEVLHHGGSLLGAASQMLSVPAHGLDVVVMTNGALVNPVQLGWQVVDTLLADHLASPSPTIVTSDRFGHLFGSRYRGDSGMVYGFGEAGGHLGLSILGSPPVPVLRDHGDTVGFSFAEAGMGPLELRVADLAARGDGKAPPTLPIRVAGRSERYRRLPAKPPSTARAGAALVGRYRSPDLAADAEIALDGERLTLRIVAAQGSRLLELEALDDDLFAARAGDPMAPTFCTLASEPHRGEATVLRLNSGRVRQLRFERSE